MASAETVAYTIAMATWHWGLTARRAGVTGSWGALALGLLAVGILAMPAQCGGKQLTALDIYAADAAEVQAAYARSAAGQAAARAQAARAVRRAPAPDVELYESDPPLPDKYSFVDFFGGHGAPSMSLEFANSNNSLYLNQLGIGGGPNGPYRSVKWDKLKTEGYGLIGMRLGGYGDGNVGGAFEISVEKRNIARQQTTARLNSGTPQKFTFGSANYLTVTSVYLLADILLRFPKRTAVEPYIGLGGGLSINRIKMPYVAGLQSDSSYFLSTPTNESAVGFVLSIPCGVRVQLTGGTQVVAEARYQVNSVLFDRGGISGENDRLVVRGIYFSLGLGFDF